MAAFSVRIFAFGGAAIAVGAMFLLHLFEVASSGSLAKPDVWEWLGILFFSTKWGVGPLIWAYAIGTALWCVAVSALSVTYLGAELSLEPKLGHPDHCGGLKPQGILCILGAAPFLVAAVFLGSIAFGFRPPRDFVALVAHAQPFKSVRFAAEFLLFFAALPIGLATLLVPVWSVHRAMSAAYDRRVRWFFPLYESAMARVSGCVVQGRFDQAVIAERDFKTIAALHPDAVPSPVWPVEP